MNVCLYMSVHHVHRVLVEAKEENIMFPETGVCRCLWAAIWMLEIKAPSWDAEPSLQSLVGFFFFWAPLSCQGIIFQFRGNSPTTKYKRKWIIFHIQVRSSVLSSSFSVLYKHHHHLLQDILTFLRRTSVPINTTHSSSLSSPLKPPFDFLSVSLSILSTSRK